MPLAKVICPFCSCSVDIMRFGDGWVGICCDKIIFNSELLPLSDLLKENV